MKRSTGLHRLREMADKCQYMLGPGGQYALHVSEFWVYGQFLDDPRSTSEWVAVAMVVDLPPEVAHWLADPSGSEHWAYSTRLAQSPLFARWRPKGHPVWNHSIRRPLLLWDEAEGVREAAFEALRADAYDALRLPEPSPEELRARLVEERDACFRAMRSATETYTEKRWAPGKKERIADPLYLASLGYLDVVDALEALPG